MEFDSVTKFLDDFDISNLLPDLSNALGKIDLVLRVAVLLAPLVILGLGLLYFLTPPKEANHSFGYRFYWGMSSVESWLFTQKLAGAVWSVLGFVMLVVMAILCGSFKGMEAMPMVEKAIRYLFWELGLIAVSCVGIDIAVMVFFNSKGERRKLGKKAAPKAAPAQEEAYEDEYQDEYDDEYYEEEYAEEYPQAYPQEGYYAEEFSQNSADSNGFYPPN